MPIVSGTSGSPTNTQVSGDEVYEWSGNGSITFSTGGTVEYLVVGGGGGGGGCAAFRSASGGGAGGMLSGTFTATASTYNITVGLGGAGGNSDGTLEARSGGDSSIAGTNAPATALGGGRGDQQNVDEHPSATDSPDGGSGGGAWFAATAGTGTAGQGNNGAQYTGGGAGEVGGTDGTYDGGDGLSNSITGTPTFYAGGGAGAAGSNVGTGGDGGGGNSNSLADGDNGTDGLGGGGGAGSATGGTANGGDGGNGTVIIRFTPTVTPTVRTGGLGRYPLGSLPLGQGQVAPSVTTTVDVITHNTTVQNATADNQYTGLEDTHIRQSDPNTAQGSNFNDGILEITKYGVNDENRSLFRATGLSNIPSNAVVSSATLYLFQTADNIEGYDVSLRRVLQPWTDADATWNQYDSTLTSPAGDWNTAGASGDGTDRESTDSSTTFVGRTLLAYHGLDCTDIVQDIVDGTISPDEGWLLFRTSGGNNSSFKVFDSSQGTDGRRPELVVEYTTGGGAGTDNLLADDVESNSELTSPSLGQTHGLLSVSVEGTTELTAPAIMQTHGLLSTSVESLSELTSPAITQTHTLLGVSVEGLSELTVPTLTRISGTDNLLADDVETTSELTSPQIAQVHNILGDDVQSLTELTSPALGQVHSLTSVSVETASELTIPLLREPTEDVLTAEDIESLTELSTPTLREGLASIVQGDGGWFIFANGRYYTNKT